MLNTFPIQFLAPLTYALLRVVLGLLCLHIGLRLKSGGSSARKKTYGLLLASAGVFLILGLGTQLAAFTTFVLSFIGIAKRTRLPGLSGTTLLLMATIAFSLFITGAGPFAFDLPI